MDKLIKVNKSIRLYCLSCMNGNSNMVKGCEIKDCGLWKYRLGRGAGRASMRLIKNHCRKCGDGTFSDIRRCEIGNCALYGYRLGKKPKN